LILLLFFFSCNYSHTKKCDENCLVCHKKEYNELGVHKNIACDVCHKKYNNSRLFVGFPKKNIQLNIDTIYSSCGKCHTKEVKAFFSSNHFLLKNCINITANIWKAEKYKNGILDIAKKNINVYDKTFLKDPKRLFVDFMRRRCLFCHFLNEGEKGFGIDRKSFCFACHQRKQNGKFLHSFTKDIKNDACLMCHNRNYVGIDYIGLQEHDYMDNTRAPYPTKYEYGSSYRYLKRDVHYKYGLRCIDCHTKANVMGKSKG
jgi:hypothetical protein